MREMIYHHIKKDQISWGKEPLKTVEDFYAEIHKVL